MFAQIGDSGLNKSSPFKCAERAIACVAQQSANAIRGMAVVKRNPPDGLEIDQANRAQTILACEESFVFSLHESAANIGADVPEFLYSIATKEAIAVGFARFANVIESVLRRVVDGEVCSWLNRYASATAFHALKQEALVLIEKTRSRSARRIFLLPTRGANRADSISRIAVLEKTVKRTVSAATATSACRKLFRHPPIIPNWFKRLPVRTAA